MIGYSSVLSMGSLLSLAGQVSGAVKVKTLEGKKIRYYKNSYPLLIGNRNYTRSCNPLSGAIRDTKEMANLFFK